MSEAMCKQKEQLRNTEARFRTKLEEETRSLTDQINQLRKEIEFQKQRQFFLQETISSKIKEVEGLKQEKESLLTRYHVFQLYFNNISHIPHSLSTVLGDNNIPSFIRKTSGCPLVFGIFLNSLLRSIKFMTLILKLYFEQDNSKFCL